MPTSDIYNVKEPAWAKKEDSSKARRRRRRRKNTESFDDVVNKDISATNRRRGKNSGFRRFRHLMRKPDFNKKFWIVTLSFGALVLALIICWDLFLRYPKSVPEEEGQLSGEQIPVSQLPVDLDTY